MSNQDHFFPFLPFTIYNDFLILFEYRKGGIVDQCGNKSEVTFTQSQTQMKFQFIFFFYCRN